MAKFLYYCLNLSCIFLKFIRLLSKQAIDFAYKFVNELMRSYDKTNNILCQILETRNMSDWVNQLGQNAPSEKLPLASQEMRVLVFSSQKGGSGKTTLCGHLAVQAQLSGSGPVALIDTDPQGSLADWWNVRSAEAPYYVHADVDSLPATIEELRKQGIKLVFVDTPPTISELVREVLQTADLVVVPTRPSPHDLRAVGASLDLIESLQKPLIFVVNGATPRSRISSQAAIALSQHGTVAPSTLHHRTDFATSMISGQTVMELKSTGKSALEIEALWLYLANRLNRLEKRQGTGLSPQDTIKDNQTFGAQPAQNRGFGQRRSAV